MVKEKKKIREGNLISTSIKKAKDLLLKEKKNTKSAVKKTTRTVAKKAKRVAKKITKKISGKKIKPSVKGKTKKAVVKKIKSPVKSKAKITATKKIRSTSKNKTTPVVRNKSINPAHEQVHNTVTEHSLPDLITHGENLHFIPEPGEAHPVTPMESHQAERIFHHREEVALNQENQKVKEALANRRNFKRYNRRTGQR